MRSHNEYKILVSGRIAVQTAATLPIDSASQATVQWLKGPAR
jgi:hypothetical protein